MIITIAICDVKKNIHDEVMSLIKNLCDDCRIDLYESGNELLKVGEQYDIYFIDIQMSDVNGIKIAEQLRDKQRTESAFESLIIFLATQREYMEDAFDVKAYHYLIKPICQKKFISVFSRAIADCKKAKQSEEKHLLLKSGSSYHIVYIKDIYYVESRDKKIIITSKDATIECYDKIQDIENSLEYSFFRCHRCYIVNMRYIVRYNTNTIWLSNGSEIYLAQKKYQEFVKAYVIFARDRGLTGT